MLALSSPPAKPTDSQAKSPLNRSPLEEFIKAVLTERGTLNGIELSDMTATELGGNSKFP